MGKEHKFLSHSFASSDSQIKVCRDDRQIFLEYEHLLSPVHQHAGEIAHKHNP